MKANSFEALKTLRKDLLKAYSDSTSMELDVSQIQKYVGDSVMRAILDDMKGTLKSHNEYDFLKEDDDVLDYRTLYKVLVPDKADSDVSQMSRRKINDYILFAKRRKSVTQSHLSNIFKGTKIIDSNFEKECSKIRVDPIEFYTSKINNDVQWAGVCDGLDIKRLMLDQLKIEVYQSFNRKNSKICALILGSSGSGKSTILRRLAIDCIKNTNFKILWIFNVSDFNDHFYEIGNSGQKYLLIIDDWNSLENGPEARTRFLNNLKEYNNVRLIIGDYYSRPIYEELLYGKKIFNLDLENNRLVVSKIIEKVDVWKNAENELLTLKDAVFKAPVFVILFVIAKTFTNKTQSNLDFDDFESQFIKIVQEDINAIYKEYSGLAIALNYWSIVYKEHKIEIQWDSLIHLANIYNNPDNQNVKQFTNFNQNNPLYEIISRYIFLEPMAMPGFENRFLIYYNHDLLLDALSKVNLRVSGLKFDNNKKIELLKNLCKRKEEVFAKNLLIDFNESFLVDYGGWQKIIDEFGLRYMEFYMLFDKVAKTIYDHFDREDIVPFAICVFYDVLTIMPVSIIDSDERFNIISIMIKKLNLMECKLQFVTQITNMIDTSQKDELEDLLLSEYKRFILSFKK